MKLLNKQFNPYLSIITICFNIEKDIDKTCKSVSSQTSKCFEWIVVDGGSTDNTLNIINKYKNNISELISESDSGIYDAMNKGIKAAKGEYLLFLNGGDLLYEPQTIENIRSSDIDGDVLYGNCAVLQKNGLQYIIDYPSPLNKEYFIEHCINHQSTLIRKSLFDRYGLYNTSYKINGDWEKWLCYITNKVEFTKLPLTVSLYKGYGGLSSSNKYKDQLNLERWKILGMYFSNEDMAKFYKAKIVSLEKELFDIKSTRFFKFWRQFSHIKEKIIGSLKTV